MVRLTKIYTKTGDDGTTSLVNNVRTKKYDDIIEAIGAVDEANSAIGMINASYELDAIQNDLFDVGAILAGSDTVTIKPERIELLELSIDEINRELPTLQSFILPKGQIHNARAVVRRAERQVWYVLEAYGIDENVAKYLNRLSDYLFVLARYDSMATKEKLWKPMGEK